MAAGRVSVGRVAVLAGCCFAASVASVAKVVDELTSLFFTTTSANTHRGDNTVNLAGANTGWVPLTFSTSRGSGVTSQTATTVAGPTNGIEIDSTNDIEWISAPLDADVTISGTITFNLRAAESDMNANAAINCIIQRLDSTGAIVSTIVQTARTTELGTSGEAAVNFTASPTSTAMLKGDRIRVRVYADDSTSNMGSGFTVTFWWNGTTAAASGDSYIFFTENLGFLTGTPAGSTLYLTDTAGPAVGANLEKEMWTSRGGGTATSTTASVNGPTAPIPITNSSGGTALEWYSKPLQAFTLADLVTCNVWAREGNTADNVSLRAELAVCDGDGSNVSVWGAGDYQRTDGVSELTTSVAVNVWPIAGDDKAVTDGQRLRLRLLIDDCAEGLMAANASGCTLTYAGTTGGVTGDTFITLSQSVAEFVAPAGGTPFRTLMGVGT